MLKRTRQPMASPRRQVRRQHKSSQPTGPFRKLPHATAETVLEQDPIAFVHRSRQTPRKEESCLEMTALDSVVTPECEAPKRRANPCEAGAQTRPARETVEKAKRGRGAGVRATGPGYEIVLQPTGLARDRVGPGPLDPVDRAAAHARLHGIPLRPSQQLHIPFDFT